MVTASARVYMDGPDTTPRREQIVMTYLNATPLSSRPGYGEVIGIRMHFGSGTAQIRRSGSGAQGGPAKAGRIGAQGCDLSAGIEPVAGRSQPEPLPIGRPGRAETLTDRYLRLLCDAGIIDATLRTRRAPTTCRFARIHADSAGRLPWRTAQQTRAKLMSWFQMPSLYPLDRLDLSVETTVDTEAQAQSPKRCSVSAILSFEGARHDRPSTARRRRSTKVTYSFVLTSAPPVATCCAFMPTV
jgi:hypothetical protein